MDDESGGAGAGIVPVAYGKVLRKDQFDGFCRTFPVRYLQADFGDDVDGLPGKGLYADRGNLCRRDINPGMQASVVLVNKDIVVVRERIELPGEGSVAILPVEIDQCGDTIGNLSLSEVGFAP
ncbi:MAG: hypothetical protein LBL57_05250 [Tannerella sp.]|nr:hypothetical protein [Tannerella sp.]